MTALDPHGRVLPCAPATEHDDARWLVAVSDLSRRCEAFGGCIMVEDDRGHVGRIVPVREVPDLPVMVDLGGDAGGA